jgi:multisubunit Na+/H+ antiporter MnhB subunit
MQVFLLGLYTARLELFKLFFFINFGAFLWCLYLVYEASGSNSRKRRRRRAIIYTTVLGVLLIGMSVTWLLSKTNIGWWFDR